MKLRQNRPLMKTILLAILMLITLEFFVVYSIMITRDSIKADLQQKEQAIQNEMEKILLNVYTISDAYVSYLSDNQSATREETESFLEHILDYQGNYVRNIAYIHGTVITFNYPYEENQSSIGVDLSLVPGQSEVIQQLIDTKEPFFQGPVELVQGGNAFILRKPVLDDGNYIGNVSTVIDADLLFDLMEEQADKNNVGLSIGFNEVDNFFQYGEDFTGTKSINTMDTDYVDLTFTVYEQYGVDYQSIINNGVRLIGILLIMIVSYYFYRNRILLDEIKHNLYHDSLTKIYNRDKFISDYDKGLINEHLVAFIDINKFKVLNDTLGHHFGDWGLIQVSNDFENLGKFNTYRNSGDEFILVSKNGMSSEEFKELAKKLKLSYYNEELKREIELTLSMGVIENVPKGLGLEDMLAYLDYAMYDSKKHNRSMTIVDSKLMEVYKEQKVMEQLLITDIKDDKLVLYYQPIIDIRQKKVTSVEVLSRWKYKGNIIPAAKFIDVAKKIRYIEVIDQNLFDKLQRDFEVFQKEVSYSDKLGFAVNFSAETLKLFEQSNKVFDHFVKNNIIDRDNLIFEVSEDINLGIISNQTLEYIKKQGYHLAIDDFGSGVSKLTDVLSGKLLAIKTDRNMLPKNKKETKQLQGFNTIIKAINAAGSTVVVEGVETKEQLEICKEAGVNIMQGYLFGKPMPIEDIIHFINNFDFKDYE